MYVNMYVCILSWVEVQEGTGSIRVEYFDIMYVCMYVCMYVRLTASILSYEFVDGLLLQGGLLIYFHSMYACMYVYYIYC